MAMYAIKDTTLTALGDAVRNKVIGTTELPIIECPKTDLSFMLAYSFEIPNAKKIKITGKLEHDYTTYHTKLKGLGVATIRGASDTIRNDKSFVIVVDEVNGYEYGTNYDTDFEIIIDSNIFTFVAPTNENATPKAYFSFTAIGLDENGNEFKYTPLEMVEKINELMTIPEKALTITGDCQYRFAYNGWSWFIEQYGDKITTKDISSCNSMFASSEDITTIPFEINLNGKKMAVSNIFMGCEALTELPKINNAYPESCAYFVQGCFNLRYIPEDYFDDWNWTDFNASSYATCGSFFNSCNSLRRIPTSFLKNYWTSATSPYSAVYSYLFSRCEALDEIKGVKVIDKAFSGNAFGNSTFGNLSRAKDIIFETNEDGTPKVAPWKNQTIDLTSYVGYRPTYILKYNSGITADKEVKDDATYQALKDDADWFTDDINYCRYNHDSAVNTINSLPDCSATGTNTIKFKGASGALTDGGAINTLTEEEIAVAVAKGWTVSLV